MKLLRVLEIPRPNRDLRLRGFAAPALPTQESALHRIGRRIDLAVLLSRSGPSVKSMHVHAKPGGLGRQNSIPCQSAQNEDVLSDAIRRRN